VACRARYTAKVDTYTVILSPDPVDGGYVAICPAMPGALTQGDSRAEALSEMSLVMAAWLDLAQEDGYAATPETPQLIAAEVASVLEDRDAEGWDRTIETTMLAPAAAVAA
jgi:predicted RNase H-like HicB family nuclease